jgi:drug/metabolite transporter (DMT)-like permease
MGGVLIKSIDLHPCAIAGCRSAIAAAVLALIARRMHFPRSPAALGTAICVTATVFLYVASTKLTTAANAILLQYTAPVYVAILSSRVLGEKVRRFDWLALALVAVGMGVFFLETVSPAHALGNALALASGLSFAGIAICLRLQKGQSTMDSLVLGHAMTAAIGLPFFLVGPAPSLRDAGLLLILGVVQLGIPYWLFSMAIRRASALEATLIPVLEPILNPIWVALAMAERPSGYAYAGGAIVIGSIVLHGWLRLRLERS